MKRLLKFKLNECAYSQYFFTFEKWKEHIDAMHNEAKHYKFSSSFFFFYKYLD